ncbi:MAG: carbon-nitrogen hydrolase family protein [Bryobacteraceae bacterium]|nr:carbon-nitrogen hydrolase family protein [Bryobacteraceae bacterium]
MTSVIRFVALSLLPLCLACILARGVEPANPARRLRVGVVQMALGRTIAEKQQRILAGISSAAARDVRVVVFPEGALRGIDGDQPALVEQAVSAIRQAAREAKVYVVFGGATYSMKLRREANWMQVIGPDGREVFRYEKLYDNHRATMPGVFLIDGIPCSAIICADRWLRGVEEIPIQQGAQVSFELSCNFATEWVAPFGWYWYVPRALRNNVWVVFANTGNKVSGAPDDPAARHELRHGHSAIIAPDGRITAAARDDVEAIVVADLDVSQATRTAALTRAAHPALRKFWEAGATLQRGGTVEAPSLKPLTAAEADITLATAQVVDDLPSMQTILARARATNADLVVFPARAIDETALPQLQAAARDHRMTVVVGTEHRRAGQRYNSAFVIGPDGSLLTRYDQLSATPPFQPGDDPSAMWFRVKGVPAVVTIGEDTLWTELAELAAVAGAQIHVHLDRDPANDPEAALRRLQVWSNLASFQTFTATANVVGSAIWDDLRDAEERRAEVQGLPRPNTGAVEVYSPFSANLVVRAGPNAPFITATRHVGARNRYHPARTSNFNPQMDAWYRFGAAIVCPEEPTRP